MKDIPIIPDEYKGEHNKNCGYTTTTPRKWTKEEIEWTKKLIENGYSNKEIAISLDRSETSVSIKVKRLGKKQNTYNQKHVEEKYELNSLFLNEIKPKSILDLYCGVNSFYKEHNVTTNDIDTNIDADFHEDAFKLICKLYYDGKKYDLIDLDPFGSAYDCFDLAIKMAKKGLIITLGELGHKRWKRLDYVGSHYDVDNLEDFTIETLIKHIQKIGLKNKVNLVVWKYREWRNIGRVYFRIEPIKVTKQWEKQTGTLNNKPIVSDIPKGQLNIFDLDASNSK
jgi:DNA-binding CsgD family transcriptional regulator